MKTHFNELSLPEYKAPNEFSFSNFSLVQSRAEKNRVAQVLCTFEQAIKTHLNDISLSEYKATNKFLFQANHYKNVEKVSGNFSVKNKMKAAYFV